MKVKTENLKRLDILRNTGRLSDREVLGTLLKQWRQKLGYCSIFAAVPTILAWHVQGARSDEARSPELSVAGQSARLPEKLKLSCSNSAFLKRQSEFLLPHQKGSFSLLAILGGNDNCPGRTIPAGNYTAETPYVDSGDTTGANNTVNIARSFFYCYYFYDVPGPDHIYSFTLTALGTNPEIRISTTSATYAPVAYVMDGRFDGCPVGTGNDRCGTFVLSGSSQGGTATINSNQMKVLPTHVPLHLFVDSSRFGAGSGPYTVHMQDVSVASAECATLNQIDCSEFFARQHYLDFLNRDADPDGLSFWANEILACGGDSQCVQIKRINVSAAFFLSIEFQETGYLAYRMYKVAFGDTSSPNVAIPVPVIRLNEFQPDAQRLGQGVRVGIGDWQGQLDANKIAYSREFVQRQRFLTAYPMSMTAAQFVDQLNLNAGNVLSTTERDQLITELNATGDVTVGRANVLQRVAENADLRQREFNRAFVLMQYYGYLRRDPDGPPDSDFRGWEFWLNKLNEFNGNFIDAEMVKAFLVSSEYRQRFGPP